MIYYTITYYTIPYHTIPYYIADAGQGYVLVGWGTFVSASACPESTFLSRCLVFCMTKHRVITITHSFYMLVYLSMFPSVCLESISPEGTKGVPRGTKRVLRGAKRTWHLERDVASNMALEMFKGYRGGPEEWGS